MALNPQHLNSLFHCSAVNTSGRNFISGDIAQMERRMHSQAPNEPKSFPNKAIFRYLNDELDFQDFCELARMETRGKLDNFIFDAESAREDYRYSLLSQSSADNKPIISRTRLVEGFKNGRIDHITGALAKREQGWVDDYNNIKFPVDEPFINIIKSIQRSVDIIQDYSIKQLEDAEECGVLYSGEKRIAELTEENGVSQWLDLDSKHTFQRGDLIRLLHHRPEPLFIFTNKLNHDYVHGSLSTDNEPRETLPVRKGMSRQGDAVYGTASINEAVKIYANPYSFESRGKLISLREAQGIDDTKLDKGHIYSMTTRANIYNADNRPRAITYSDIPSLPMTLMLAEESQINLKFATSKWVDMKNSSSTFEVYQHLTELSNACRLQSKNLFQDAIKGLGFDGIEIAIPTAELEHYKYKRQNVENKPESLFTEYCVSKVEVLKQLDKYINEMAYSIPAKAEVAHLLVFSESNVQRDHITLLPPAVKVSYGDTPPDNIYYSKDPITLDSLKVRANDSVEHDVSLTM